MAHSLQLAVLLLLTSSYIIRAQNNTNGTVTSEPTSTSTTMFHTSEPSTAKPTNTLSPTIEPTVSPNTSPSYSPSASPLIPLSDDDYTQVMKATCKSSIPGSITCLKVEGAQRTFWVTAAKDAICKGGTIKDDTCIVQVGDCEDIKDDETGRRLLLETSDIIGVTITYLIVLSDASLINAHEQRINNGEFDQEFSETINDEYDGEIQIEVEFEEATVGNADDFLGNEDPTFGEIIASPYILLGIVCTIVGIIWLLFLRSSIENKYPSYLSQPASMNSSAGNAVEMVPQSSAADAGQKQKNKQELQQAWNESDAE